MTSQHQIYIEDQYQYQYHSSSSQSLFGQVTSAFPRPSIGWSSQGIPSWAMAKAPPGTALGSPRWSNRCNGRFITWQSSKNDVENWALEKMGKIHLEFLRIAMENTQFMNEWTYIWNGWKLKPKTRRGCFATSLGRQLWSAIVTECASDSFRWLYQQLGTSASEGQPEPCHHLLARHLQPVYRCKSGRLLRTAPWFSWPWMSRYSNMLLTGEAFQMQQSASEFRWNSPCFMQSIHTFHPFSICSSILHIPQEKIQFHPTGCWCCPASWASSAPWSAATKPPSRSSACRQLGMAMAPGKLGIFEDFLEKTGWSGSLWLKFDSVCFWWNGQFDMRSMKCLKGTEVVHLRNPAKTAKFWPLSQEYNILAPKHRKTPGTFLSKKSVLGRSFLNHIQVVLLQVVIPMLQLLVPASSTEWATEEPCMTC